MPLPTTHNTTSPQARGFGARIDDLLLRLAVGPGRELAIESAPLQANRVQTSENPTEFFSDFGDIFGRADFTGGEGLRYAHRSDRPANAEARFWDSENVDVSQPPDREDAGIRLLHSTEQIDASVETNLALVWNGTNLYMAAGTTLRSSSTPLASSPGFTDESPHAGESATMVEGVAALGGDVYAALGVNGIHRYTGVSWAHWNDLQADGAWSVKGRIVASKGQSFYEVASSGAAPSPIVTLPAGKVWTSAVDAGDAILATATDGYIYAFAADDAGVLVLLAQSPVSGEEPQAVAYTQGVVVYATSQVTETGTIGRLWRADLTDGYTLANAQLLRQWGDEDVTVDRSPRAALALRDAVLVGVRDTASKSHLWRFDLASGGIVRDLTLDAGGLVQGLASIDGRTFATVAGDGLWRETTDLAASGYLIGPLGDFFSAEEKSWVSARIDTAPVAASESVELFYTVDPAALSDPDSPAWVRVKHVSGGPDTTETPLRGAFSRFIAGMVKVSTTGATSPVVRAFSFRSYPGPGDVIVTIPVNVSDLVESVGRRPRKIPGRGHLFFSELLAREGRGALLEIYRPSLRVRGLIESVGVPMQGRGDRGSQTVYALVRFRGRKTSLGTAAVGGSMGVQTMGIEGMGG